MSRTVSAKDGERFKYSIHDYNINVFWNGKNVLFKGAPTIPAADFLDILKANSLMGTYDKIGFRLFCNTLPPGPPNPPEPEPVVSKTWNIVAIVLEVVFLAIIIVTCIFVNRRKPVNAETENPGEEMK